MHYPFLRQMQFGRKIAECTAGHGWQGGSLAELAVGIVGFEDEFVEFEEAFDSRAEMIGPVETVGNEDENELCLDSLGQTTNKEGVPITANMVHLVDEQDQIAAVIAQVGFDTEHKFFQGESLLVLLLEAVMLLCDSLPIIHF